MYIGHEFSQVRAITAIMTASFLPNLTVTQILCHTQQPRSFGMTQITVCCRNKKKRTPGLRYNMHRIREN